MRPKHTCCSPARGLCQESRLDVHSTDLNAATGLVGPPTHGRGAHSGCPLSLLTLDELAAHLRLSQRTIRRLVAARRLPCIRFGRQLRFDPADVFRFVSARKD